MNRNSLLERQARVAAMITLDRSERSQWPPRRRSSPSRGAWPRKVRRPNNLGSKWHETDDLTAA